MKTSMRSIFLEFNDPRNEAGLLVLLPFRCQIHFFDHRHLATPGPVTYQATLAFFVLCHTFFHLLPNRATVYKFMRHFQVILPGFCRSEHVACFGRIVHYSKTIIAVSWHFHFPTIHSCGARRPSLVSGEAEFHM